MQKPRAAVLEANINVTPLVDVCLVLLIIFMVVTPVIVNGVPVQLPPSSTAETAGEAKRQLSITVKDDDTLFVGASVLRGEQLAGELESIHRTAPDRPVSIRGDKRVAYGKVLDVLSACRTAGFENVGLMTESR